VIARNEYRIRTSRIRRIRPYFIPISIVLLALFIVFAAPALINPIFDALDIEAFIISYAAVALMQIILFFFFFYFLMFPIGNTLKDIDVNEYEIFLSAPVRSSDVLLGKFMGVMPFYAIAIAIATGILTAFMIPLGIDLIQIAIIVVTFIITFLVAFWIGTVIAAMLKTKLSKSARGRDIGKALPLIIALPMIAIMYALMGGGLVEALYSPDASELARTIMAVFPSSWGAELMVIFALNPGNIPAIWFETLTRFGGLVLFFIASLWIGAKIANRAYTLETTTFSAATAKPDGYFYNSVKSAGGGKSFGTIVVSIFKDYVRRFENISKVAYVVGLLVIMGVFFGFRDNSMESIEMGIFIFPFLAGFVVGEVTVRGKENFFIYRKAPGGEGTLIKARMLQSLMIIIPIAAVYAALSLLLVPGITVLDWFAYIVLMVLIVAAYVAFALGLFLMIPVFTDKPAELMGNIMIIMFVSIFLFIMSIILFDGIFVMISMLVMVWLLGISFLYMGKLRLSNIE
jgi:hypothetical protein